MSAHCLVLSCLHIVTRTRTVAQVMSLSHHPHVHVHVSVSPRLALPCYFPHFLPHSFYFLLHLKFADNLRTPPKESMDLSDEFLLSTGYEPNAYDFKETSVEPYTELLDSSPLFSDKVSSADADYDDAALEGMLHEAHRVHSHHFLREDLSVSLSSSSMSDRTVRSVGDRTGRPAEQRNQEAQIRTLLDKQKEQILAECQARINRHEFQAAYRPTPLRTPSGKKSKTCKNEQKMKKCKNFKVGTTSSGPPSGKNQRHKKIDIFLKKKQTMMMNYHDCVSYAVNLIS